MMLGNHLRLRWLRHPVVVVARVLTLGLVPLLISTVGNAQQSPLQAKGAAVAAWAATSLAFTDVTVVDVTDGRLLPAQTVVIRGNRIQALGRTREVQLPRGTQVIDARNKYLIPGLWDMHIHPFDLVDLYYPLLVANGITGGREPGTVVPLAQILQWRREIAAGTRVGPRLVTAGPSLGGFLAVNTPAEGRRIVDSLKTAGADLIKVSELPKEIYFAIASEARRVGLSWGGHIPGGRLPTQPVPVSVIEVSDSGGGILDHDIGLQGLCTGDSAGNVVHVDTCTPVAERLRHNGMWVVPTLLITKTLLPLARTTGRPSGPFAVSLQESAGVLRLRRQAGARTNMPASTDSVPVWVSMDVMQRASMPMLAGTDAAPTFHDWLVPGFSLHEELATMVWAGLTPLTALQAATLNPARALGAADSLGTIAPGKLADLVLLDANPLEDIRNTTKIRAVMANGRYFGRAMLDGLIAQAEQGGQRRAP